MGGYGSGPRRTRLRMRAARAMILDVNSLIRAARQAGCPVICRGVWSWQPGGTMAPVAWALSLDPEHGTGTLRLRHEFRQVGSATGAHESAVRLTATVPTYGG